MAIRRQVPGMQPLLPSLDGCDSNVDIGDSLYSEQDECFLLGSYSQETSVTVGEAGEDEDVDTVDAVISVSPRNTLNELTGREWLPETKSFWFQKGLGAAHPHARIERLHPAPFSYQDVLRLVRFFTKTGGRVLDPFAGVASTLKACALSGRRGVGVELSLQWAELGRERLLAEVGPGALESQEIVQGDARRVLADEQRFPDACFDLCVTSPPYWAILNKDADHKVREARLENGLATRYSEDGDDLGNIEDYGEFLRQVAVVFGHVHRLLKPGAYCCVVVGDFRHGSRYIPYHADLINLLTAAAILPAGESLPTPGAQQYELQGITVLAQNHKRLYPYGYPTTYVPNIHHQNILVLRKPKQPARPKSARKSRLHSPAHQDDHATLSEAAYGE